MSGKSIISLLVCLVTLALWIHEERLYAQGRTHAQNTSLREEDLTTGEIVSPGEEFSEEATEEEEDPHELPPVLPKDFSRDQDRRLSPSSAESSSLPAEPLEPRDLSQSEALVPIDNTMPALPTANMLSPQDRVALHFVEAGVEALTREDFEQAKEQFERALEIAPLQPYSYYFLGRLAFVRGEHRKALLLLQKADLLFIRGDQAWRGETARLKGAVYEDLGDYTHARTSYRLCLQLAPYNLRAMSALARLASEEPYSSATFSR